MVQYDALTRKKKYDSTDKIYCVIYIIRCTLATPHILVDETEIDIVIDDGTRRRRCVH